MKKLVFFLVLFTFLIASAWGQTTYTFNGYGSIGAPVDWNNPSNWTPNGIPGQQAGDIVIIGANSFAGISAALDFPIESLTLSNGAGLVTNSGITLTTNDLIITSTGNASSINGTINVTGTTTLNTNLWPYSIPAGSSVTTVNLTIGTTDFSNDLNFDGDFTMGGARISYVASTRMVTVTANTASSIGTLIVGDRNITITGAGGIQAGSSGVIRLESGRNITIGTQVTATQLIAISTNTTSGTVDFGSSTVTTSGSGTEGESASIYVKAYDFTASGSDTINPGSGELCLNLGNSSAYSNPPGGSFDTQVVDQKYHIDGLIVTPPDPALLHLVYYDSSMTEAAIQAVPAFTPNSAYNFVPSSSAGPFTVESNKNIYIYNVGNIGSRSFTVNNGANRTGFIEISGAYTSSDIPTLDPGSGGIRLNNATVTLTGNNFDISSHPLTLVGTGNTNTITAATVTLGAVTGGGNALTIAGNAVFGGAVSGVTTLSVSGTSAINANVTTTGNQTYTGAVTLSGGARTLEGTNVTLGTVTGGGNALTITGNAVFGDAVSGVTTLSVSGTSAINADITTTGNQTYTGAVTLNADRTFIASAGSLITFGSTVRSSNATARALTITTANVQFDGAVGIAGNPISTLTVNAGTAYINANITTSSTNANSQRYNGSVVLGADVIFTGGTGNNVTIRFDGTVNSDGTARALTAATYARFTNLVGNTSPLASVTFNGTGAGNSRIVRSVITTGDQTYNVPITLGNATNDSVNLTANAGSLITFGGTVASNNTTARALTITNADVRFNGTVGIANPVSTLTVNAGTATINANVTTTGTGTAQHYYGPVVLGANVTFTGAAGSTVRFGNTVNGAFGLTITTANVQFDGNVGLGSVSVGTSAVNAGTATINAANITTTGANGQRYYGAVTSAGVIRLESSGSDILLDGPVSGSRLLAIAGITGTVTIGDTVTLSGTGNEGLNAAMYVRANTFTVTNTTLNSIVPGGSGGQLCLWLENPWLDTNVVVDGVEDSRWHQHHSVNIPNNKNIVYGTGTTPPAGYEDTDLYFYIDSTNPYITNDEFRVSAGFNIYIINVGTTSREVTFGVTGSGVIEIQGNYTSSSNLTLEPGTGGIRLVDASITLTGRDFDTDGKKVELTGSSGNSITAANVILGGAVSGDGNFTVKATSGNIATVGIDTGTSGKIRLESGGNITVGGAVEGYQLIAIAANGSVTVHSVTIDENNTGYEDEDAAIFIEADSFHANGVAGSIVPGGDGGQLCLKLTTPWVDNGAVDGPENERWHQDHIQKIVKILYSFTEDANGDGRLDRVRVQASVALYGDFSSFDVNVADYEIDRSKGDNGFEKVSSNNDSFYIYLKQKPELDGGNTPQWSVTRNSSLKDDTGTSFIGNPSTDRNITPIDTIPPRIAYTLTLPGYPQTYVQMSEPVDSTAVALVNSFDGITPINGASSADSLGLGYVLDLTTPIEVDTLAELNITNGSPAIGYLNVKDMVDRSTAALLADPGDPPPRYPTNWGYTAYAADSGSNVFKPPHSLIDNTVPSLNSITTVYSDPVIRRVTDVLVSIPPSSADSDKYFVWPVWAKYQDTVDSGNIPTPDDLFGQNNADSGTVWVFDGTKSLEVQSYELQARMNSKLEGFNMELFWASNVPQDFRNPALAGERGKGSGGLWIPDLHDNPLYYYVPLSSGINSSAAKSTSSFLYNFILDKDTSGFSSGEKLDFIFRLKDDDKIDFFAARLDIASGAAIPDNWYTLVRPFSFDIQNVRTQRGGVSVLNNVINSNNRENAYIRYNLARGGRVTIQIYTLEGTLVKSLRRNEHRDAGDWTDSWDGSNNGGRAVARGMYFVRVVAPDIDEIRKIMVIK